MITATQFRRAQILARAHGHEWGGVRCTIVRPSVPGEARYPLPHVEQDPAPSRADEEPLTLTLPAEEAAVCDAIESALEPGRNMPGLSFAVTHTTGSGRLSWHVSEDGTVHLVVSRPGQTLLALRALAGALGALAVLLPEDHAMLPLLAGLGGEGLRSGGMSADAPAELARKEHEAGVWVLQAEVSPGGEVAVRERTRYDVTSDADAAEFRHWLVLAELIQALGVVGRPTWARFEVATALLAYDAVQEPVREAERARDKALADPGREMGRTGRAEGEPEPAMAAYYAACEAVRIAEAPRIEAAYRASIYPRPVGPVVECGDA